MFPDSFIQEIALNQIETALRLFFAEQDLFSIIALAGAAEEILSELPAGPAKRSGPFTPLFEILRPLQKKKEERQPVVVGEMESFIHTDPYQEAVFLLGKAIDDYQTLAGTLSQAMQRFNQEVRSAAGPGPAPVPKREG